MTTEDQVKGPAWPFILAGVAGLAVALIRTILGGEGDLAPLAEALADNPLLPVVYINWYALSTIMAVMGAALLVAVRLSRPARQAIAVLAALCFGAVGLWFMGITWSATGSPFTFFPWMPLSLTTLLCALAAWKAAPPSSRWRWRAARRRAAGTGGSGAKPRASARR